MNEKQQPNEMGVTGSCRWDTVQTTSRQADALVTAGRLLTQDHKPVGKHKRAVAWTDGEVQSHGWSHRHERVVATVGRERATARSPTSPWFSHHPHQLWWPLASAQSALPAWQQVSTGDHHQRRRAAAAGRKVHVPSQPPHYQNEKWRRR